MPKDKDLFGIDNDIPTLDSIAGQAAPAPTSAAKPDPFQLDEEPHFLDADMPSFGQTAARPPAAAPTAAPQPKLDLAKIEALIQPIVERKIQQFARELSRVVAKEVMDVIEEELQR